MDGSGEDYADPEISPESRRESVFGSRPPTVGGGKHKSSISILPIPNERDWKVARIIYALLRLTVPTNFFQIWNEEYKSEFKIVIIDKPNKVTPYNYCLLDYICVTGFVRNLDLIHLKSF